MMGRRKSEYSSIEALCSYVDGDSSANERLIEFAKEAYSARCTEPRMFPRS